MNRQVETLVLFHSASPINKIMLFLKKNYTTNVMAAIVIKHEKRNMWSAVFSPK